jgi:hypothetical protein
MRHKSPTPNYFISIISFIILTCFLSISSLLHAQSSNDILNLLVANKSVTEEQADSIRAEAAIKQQSSLPDKKFQIDAEYRIRPEYREGYQQMRNDTTSAASFTGQRTRISFGYFNSNKFSSLITIQDIRVWGQQDPRSVTPSTLQLFEGWAEPHITPDLSVRLGRQKLIYDNQRLFADNNWRTGAASYDAVTFKYNNDKIATDLVGAFNQSSERLRGTDFAPVGFTSFKLLIMSYLKTKIFTNTTLTLINSGDGFQATDNPEKINMRYTDGGRIEYEKGKFYATVASYYQWGTLVSGKKVSAWYVQPEIKLNKISIFQFRLGAEVFSGTASETPKDEDHSFVPLLGSGHTFNGSLDLFTRFPNDVAGFGFVNPYFFVNCTLSPKFDLRVDFHYFATMETPVINKVTLNKYMGFENDLLLGWKPNSYTRIEAGFSYAFLSEDCEILKKAQPGSHLLSPYFFYVSIGFKPVLFTQMFK